MVGVLRKPIAIGWVLAAGALLLLLWTAQRLYETRHAQKATAVLLSCMDYRLMDNLRQFMRTQGFGDNYDHFIFAGSSLGVLQEEFPSWRTTFRDHLELARGLHGITTIYAVDHMDCGAYHKLLPEIAERTAHEETLRRFRAEVEAESPVKVRTFLMETDGSTREIS